MTVSGNFQTNLNFNTKLPQLKKKEEANTEDKKTELSNQNATLDKAQGKKQSAATTAVFGTMVTSSVKDIQKKADINAATFNFADAGEQKGLTMTGVSAKDFPPPSPAKGKILAAAYDMHDAIFGEPELSFCATDEARGAQVA